MSSFALGTTFLFAILSLPVSYVRNGNYRRSALIFLSLLYLTVVSSVFTVLFVIVYALVFRKALLHTKKRPITIAVVVVFSAAYWLFYFVPVLEGILLHTPFGAIGMGVLLLKYLDIAVNRRNPGGISDFILYSVFFPSFLMGPLVKPEEFRAMDPRRREGAQLIFKALIIYVGLYIAMAVYRALYPGIGWSYPLVALAYGFIFFLQLWGFFTLAYGLSLVVGFPLKDNFPRFPYASGTISTFWRNWNATVMEALRDTVYIPLGGRERRYAAVFAVFIFSATWHVYMYCYPGSDYSAMLFLAWGLYSFATFVILDIAEKRWGLSSGPLAPIMPFVITLTVSMGWTFFGRPPYVVLGI